MSEPLARDARGAAALPPAFVTPLREYSIMPFWFWNDGLDEGEIVRQIDAFEAHGVFGFVLHPRVGLPGDCGWMSDRLLQFMRIAIERAAERGMSVILYDEGMYPSGAASGRVVAEDAGYACRGLVKVDGRVDALPAGHHLVAECELHDGGIASIIDRPIGSWIRGLHYTGDDTRRSASGWEARDTPEDRPPAADLLNPEAVACFIRHSYERYFEAFGGHFGHTITAIFTDEPMVLGRGNQLDARPGTTGILEHVNEYLGYDFAPHLPALWDDDEPDARRYREAYHRAVNHRLEETYYSALSGWCTGHGVALTGHPAGPDDIGHLRHFHWPGQDVVWRRIAPGASAVSGRQSTQAKCAASAAVHLKRKRNANEFMGAYGHAVPRSLYEFMAGWLLVRGCNLLIPHAYFYSVRGPRIDECPPQLGPHGAWWGSQELADLHRGWQRLCWLNTDCTPRVSVAVLGESDELPIDPARDLLEQQIDFHYLEQRHLWEEAQVEPNGVRLADMHYDVLVGQKDRLDDRARRALGRLEPGRCVWADPAGGGGLLIQRRLLSHPCPRLDPPDRWLRVRQVVKEGRLWTMLFNDGEQAIEGMLDLGEGHPTHEVDVAKGRVARTVDPRGQAIRLASGQLVLMVSGVGG